MQWKRDLAAAVDQNRVRITSAFDPLSLPPLDLDGNWNVYFNQKFRIWTRPQRAA